MGYDLDIIEVFWFHELQTYQNCASLSGWSAGKHYEWRPDLGNDCWREPRLESERLLVSFQRSQH
jgi:hypothetical protein